MKFYKYLNTQTGKSLKVTESGAKLYGEHPVLRKTMKLLFECNQLGERLDGKKTFPTHAEKMEEIFELKTNESNESKIEEKKNEGLGESGTSNGTNESGKPAKRGKKAK